MLSVRHTLYRIRSRILGAVLTLGSTAFLLAASVVAGWGSAWYMVEAGSRLTTRSSGPWVSWISAARPDADPYTRAHFVRAGSLQLNAAVATTWQARADSGGQRLHSACDYLVEGGIEAPWWSIAVFDDAGRLISNAAERHSYTSDTMALGADGRFSVTLGRDARPGNWLPTGGAGRLSLVLVVLDQRSVLADEGPGTRAPLPEIRRLVCR
jgi:hypothetical protein